MVETPAKLIIICFVPEGILVKSIVVPEVEATGVPNVRPPLPLAAAQVPSPRQNVELLALVPLFKLVTGKFPVTPVVKGSPVQFANAPDVGVPKIGVTNVGEVAKTKAPDPVSSVTAEAKFAEDGVARNVAMPVPNPLTPVEIGSPVQLVSVPDDGVPNTGVTRVGDVARTIDPLPVVEAALMAVPLPDKIPVTVVFIVIAGVVVAVATVPAKPFADTTETPVTVPDPGVMPTILS